MWYSVGAPTGEASIEPNQRGPARKGRPSFFFCPSQPKAPSRPKALRPSRFTPRRRSRPCRFPVRFAVGSCRRKNVPTPYPPPFYRRAPLRVGAPTPTTPRRSPPALKRRGLRGASQHRPLYSFLGACATCRPLACRLAWAGEAPYHSPGQNARVKCTAPPLFLLGGAALAFCPCLLRQGAHPEGTAPLPWPVGPAGPRAGLARRQSDAAQLGPLYDGGAKLGRLLKRGRARRVAPAGLYPPWGASARPLGWRPGVPAGTGAPAGAGPTFNGCCPLLPCWDPHCSTASRVCARRSRPATHPAGDHIRKPPASSPAAALRRAVPLILCGPGP